MFHDSELLVRAIQDERRAEAARHRRARALRDQSTPKVRRLLPGWAAVHRPVPAS